MFLHVSYIDRGWTCYF